SERNARSRVTFRYVAPPRKSRVDSWTNPGKVATASACGIRALRRISASSLVVMGGTGVGPSSTTFGVSFGSYRTQATVVPRTRNTAEQATISDTTPRAVNPCKSLVTLAIEPHSGLFGTFI